MSLGDVEISRAGLRAAGMTIRPPRLRGPGGAPEHAFVAYQLVSGEHRQLGVVVELSVDDYRTGRIRRHEAIDPQRLRQVEESLAAGPAEPVPVTLFHPARPTLRSLLAEATAGTPDFARAHEDGVSELGWIDHDRDRAQALQAELAQLDAIYLADGHHRMAALERHATRRSGHGLILAAVFPADEMRILAYHRFLTRPEQLSTSELLDLLARLPAAASVTECVTATDHEPAPGVVVLRLDGRWYRIELRAPRHGAEPGRALDIVTLEEGILAPMLAGAHVGADVRVTAIPGTSDIPTIGRHCDDRRAIGFLLNPPTVGQIITVADTGQTVPPKSTWFDPKPRPGMLHPAETGS